MKKSLLRDIIILLAFFGIIWYVFSEFDIFPDKTSLKISIEKEEKLGEKMIENILKNPDFKEINDSIIDSAIFVIKKRLEDAIGLTDFEYHIFVVNNSIVNAFTLPGGNIIVTSGLINLCNSAEELASVVAHEMGHVENRDVIQKLIKDIGISLIMSDDIMVLGEITRTASSTVFDRRQESEADKFALDLLKNAKINPRILATFFRRIRDEVGSYNERFEIVMTHPHVNSRIKAALEYNIPDGFATEPFEIDWNRIKSSVSN